MKIFSDFHHSGLARSMFYLFADRLNHQLYFPSASFTLSHGTLTSNGHQLGIWGTCDERFPINMGGIDLDVWRDNVSICTYDEFMNTDFDIVLITRTESQDILAPLINQHPSRNNIKVIGVSGNEATVYNWNLVKNLIACDSSTYRLSPSYIHKIQYVEEIGHLYGEKFVPITEESLHIVSGFMNNMLGYNKDFRWNHDMYHGFCPHCGGNQDGYFNPVNVYNLWNECKLYLSDKYTFIPYGHGNDELGGRNLLDKDIPNAHYNSAVTWHFKTFEGWGHSLLQSIACGRLVLIPKQFYRYRSAGHYLIPNLTCIECDWNVTSIINAIQFITQDLDRANELSQACYDVVKKLFRWDLDLIRFKEWFKNIR